MDPNVPASGSLPAAPSLEGTILDNRYRIVRKLGEGGMGEVYAAEHMHIEKRFAIKLLRPEIVSNPEAVSRFRQEARSSSSIGHRNIIAIEDFGQLQDGRIYMCMELLNGAALNDLITTPQPIDRLLNILIQTGHGLAAAHAKNIVHRDMKPENIFVTINGNEDVPKLLDFGIAKVAGNDGNNNLTKTGTIFGTPFYMAPEQALGNTVDARTDVYAMGVIMYEVFAGSLPFQGESFMGILTQHITTEPEPVATRAGKAGRQLPPGLADIITRCMQKNPPQRFQTMDELVNALVGIYRGIAGPGMSTYMEAFPAHPTSGRMAVPTPGPMQVQHGTGGVAPTVGVGTPPPMGQRHPTGPAPHHHPTGPGVSPSGPNYPVSGSGLYDPNAGVVPVPKKSKTGLIIAILVILLAAGGGVAAFVITQGDDGGGGSGSQVASGSTEGIDAGGGGTTPTPDAESGGTVGKEVDAGGGTTVAEIDAGTPANDPPDAGVTDPPPTPDAGTPLPVGKPVMVVTKNVGEFEIFEDGQKLADGPGEVTVGDGVTRTITIKAKGYKDKVVVLDGKTARVSVKLDRLPPATCTTTGCPAGQKCGADGKCKPIVVAPRTCPEVPCGPGMDCNNGVCLKKVTGPNCANVIVDPRNKACVKQYCALHKDDVRCDAE
jgi:serine/threonine protein kinase